MKRLWVALAVWWLVLAVVDGVRGNWLAASQDATLAVTSWYVSVLLAERGAS